MTLQETLDHLSRALDLYKKAVEVGVAEQVRTDLHDLALRLSASLSGHKCEPAQAPPPNPWTLPVSFPWPGTAPYHPPFGPVTVTFAAGDQTEPR